MMVSIISKRSDYVPPTPVVLEDSNCRSRRKPVATGYSDRAIQMSIAPLCAVKPLVRLQCATVFRFNGSRPKSPEIQPGP